MLQGLRGWHVACRFLLLSATSIVGGSCKTLLRKTVERVKINSAMAGQRRPFKTCICLRPNDWQACYQEGRYEQILAASFKGPMIYKHDNGQIWFHCWSHEKRLIDCGGVVFLSIVVEKEKGACDNTKKSNLSQLDTLFFYRHCWDTSLFTLYRACCVPVRHWLFH